MELSFNELKKRDVINLPDGRCLGRITDLRMEFPKGNLAGIVVPGRKSRRIFAFLDRSEIYIDRSRIIKIGGDVILVDISTSPVPPPCPPRHKSEKHCAPVCQPQSPPQYPRPPAPQPRNSEVEGEFNFTIFPENNDRIDTGDY